MEDDAAAAAVAVSKVLGDDNLLVEILLLVGFPTTLVRAAAVCKRWLHHASDKAFLRRFRKLNPPRLLGFYIERVDGSPRFVPVIPQPPELAAAVRIVGGYGFGAGNDGESLVLLDCRNGTVSTSRRHGSVTSIGVHSPLCPERAMAIDRPLSPMQHHPRYHSPPSFLILSREEKDGGLSYFCVFPENPMMLDITSATNFTAHAFILEDGVWRMIASATTQIDHWRPGLQAVLVDNKIYMTATYIDITVLDLLTSSFSTIQTPQGVGYFELSQADNASSVYLIGVKEEQLGIWLYKGDSWLIVDTICLHEMCANLIISHSCLWISHVGDNAEFVILQMGRLVLYLDMRCRTLRTLYEMSEVRIDNIKPFMMIWPPTFPSLKCDPTRFAFWPLDNLYITLVEFSNVHLPSHCLV